MTAEHVDSVEMKMKESGIENLGERERSKRNVIERREGH